MKFFSLLLLLAFVGLAAASHPFKTCGTDRLGVQQFLLSPDPIQSGQPLNGTVVGVSSVVVDPGSKVNLVLSVAGIPVKDITLDVCSTISCPVQPGQPYSISIVQDVPEGTPSLTADAKIKVFNSGGQQLTCLQTQITIQGVFGPAALTTTVSGVTSAIDRMVGVSALTTGASVLP